MIIPSQLDTRNTSTDISALSKTGTKVVPNLGPLEKSGTTVVSFVKKKKKTGAKMVHKLKIDKG